MEPKTVGGLKLFPPGIVQRLDKGDPQKTMDAAEKFLDKASYRLFKATEARSKKQVEKVLGDTSDWVGWFRHHTTFLGDADSWDEHTLARFRALRGWCEQFYNRCCDANGELYHAKQAKKR
jgi:hypothetical protein